jgi:phosphotriesterase-related protein
VSRLVRTVTGDVPPGDLGVTNYHEHLFQATPLLPGEELDDEAASRAEAVALRDAGTTTMVEATPIGLGRDPAAVARISRGTGLRVVHTTGVHRHEHYAPGDPLLECGDDELEDLFRREIDRGIGDTGVRAGLVKAGVGLWSIGPFERRALAAAGRLGADPGVPVMVHLEHGSAAHEVLDLLAAEGCPAERVALAHVDRNPDPGLHAELAARGAYLGYDGAGRHQRWPDSVLVECLATTVAAGGGERILLGGDVARRSRYTSYGGMPGLAYLLRRFVPRVRSAVGDRATDLLLRDNPARWLAWDVAA